MQLNKHHHITTKYFNISPSLCAIWHYPCGYLLFDIITRYCHFTATTTTKKDRSTESITLLILVPGAATFTIIKRVAPKYNKQYIGGFIIVVQAPLKHAQYVKAILVEDTNDIVTECVLRVVRTSQLRSKMCPSF